MVSGIICPDCGGVVGAIESTEEGDPCRCFVGSSKPSSDAGDTDSSGPAAPPPVSKICRICGKDTAGQKRVRDHTGYACYECDKQEQKALNHGRVRCRSCGHLHKEELLTEYEGRRICKTCLDEKNAAKKAKMARMGFQGARKRTEAKQVVKLALVLIILGGIILIGLWMRAKH